MSASEYESAKEFVEKMDRGDFDGRLNAEMQKLSREQLSEVTAILGERMPQPGNSE